MVDQFDPPPRSIFHSFSAFTELDSLTVNSSCPIRNRELAGPELAGPVPTGFGGRFFQRPAAIFFFGNRLSDARAVGQDWFKNGELARAAV